MKRAGNLMEKLIHKDNIGKAIDNAARRKSKLWYVKEIKKDRKNYIYRIRHMLRSEALPKTHTYKKEVIKDSRKEREIIKEYYYPWKILQHAFIQILEPIFSPTLISTTCSCIKERGLHYAIKCLKHALRNHKKATYFWAVDFRKFYASVPHELIDKTLRSKIKDEKFIRLFEELVFSYKSDDDLKQLLLDEQMKYIIDYPQFPQNLCKIDVDRGITIGAYTSQMLANWVLSPLDHYMKEVVKCKSYVRYCDDVVGLAETKEEAVYQANKYIEKAQEMGLVIKANVQIAPILVEKNGVRKGKWINFVGAMFSKNCGIRLRRNIRYKFKKYFNRAKSKRRIKEVDNAYRGWCLATDSKHLYKRVTGKKLKLI